MYQHNNGQPFTAPIPLVYPGPPQGQPMQQQFVPPMPPQGIPMAPYPVDQFGQPMAPLPLWVGPYGQPMFTPPPATFPYPQPVDPYGQPMYGAPQAFHAAPPPQPHQPAPPANPVEAAAQNGNIRFLSSGSKHFRDGSTTLTQPRVTGFIKNNFHLFRATDDGAYWYQVERGQSIRFRFRNQTIEVFHVGPEGGGVPNTGAGAQSSNWRKKT